MISLMSFSRLQLVHFRLLLLKIAVKHLKTTAFIITHYTKLHVSDASYLVISQKPITSVLIILPNIQRKRVACVVSQDRKRNTLASFIPSHLKICIPYPNRLIFSEDGESMSAVYMNVAILDVFYCLLKRQ